MSPIVRIIAAGPSRLAAPANSAPPVAPARLGDWELESLIARGTFCRVHRARAAGSDHAEYAVKLLVDRWQGDAWATGLLAREAAVAASVAHPHLVSVLAYDRAAAQPYLVLPWLPGFSLRQLLAARGALDIPEALAIARQAASALAALHAAGWMHADVKPGNIQVSPEGHATLLDLGFACRLDGTPPARVVGTWEYLAPEWTATGRQPDECSDLFSLGAVLLEMLLGAGGDARASRADTVRAMPHSDAPRRMVDETHDRSRRAPHVPPRLQQLIRRLLANDPLRRPQSAAELVDELTWLEVATFSERGFGAPADRPKAA